MYISILPVAYIISFAAELSKRNAKFLILFFLLQFMGVILALDHNMADFFNYAEHYYYVPTFSNILDGASFETIYGEPLFALIQVLCKSLGLDYIDFRLIFFSIMMFFNAVFIFKFKSYSHIMLLWYFAFYYHNDGNIMRTAFSSTLLMLSVFYLGERKSKVSLLYYLGAVLFHYSSIVFLFVYLICYLNLGRRFVFISLVTSFFIAIFIGGRNILIWLISYFGDSSFLIQKLYHYAFEYDNGTGGIIRFIILIPMLIITFTMLKYEELIKEQSTKVYFLSFSMALCLLVVFSDFRLFSERYFTLLGWSGAAVLITTFNSFKGDSNLLYKGVWILLLFTFSMYKYMGYQWLIYF